MRTSTKKQPFLMRAATTLLLAMLMLASAPWTAWAQVNIPGLTYNSAGGYYEIGSSDDLWSLRNYANSSNGGGAVSK